MADRKLTQITEVTSHDPDDLMYVVRNSTSYKMKTGIGHPIRFDSRSDIVTYLSGATPPTNTILKDSQTGLEWLYDGSSSVIPDMDNCVPVGQISPLHFGENTTPGTTDMRVAIQRAAYYAAKISEESAGTNSSNNSNDNNTINPAINVECFSQQMAIEGQSVFLNGVCGVRILNGNFLATGTWNPNTPMFIMAEDNTGLSAERVVFENCHFEGDHICPGFLKFDNTKHRCAVINCTGHGPTEFGFRATGPKNSDFTVEGCRICQYEFGETNWDDPSLRTAVLIDVETTDSRIVDNTPFYCKIPLRCSGASMQIIGNHPFNGGFSGNIDGDDMLSAVLNIDSGVITDNYFDNGVVRIYANKAGASTYSNNYHIKLQETSTQEFIQFYAPDGATDLELEGWSVTNNIFRELGDPGTSPPTFANPMNSEFAFKTEGTGSFGTGLRLYTSGNMRIKGNYTRSQNTIGPARGLAFFRMPPDSYIGIVDDSGNQSLRIRATDTDQGFALSPVKSNGDVDFNKQFTYDVNSPRWNFGLSLDGGHLPIAFDNRSDFVSWVSGNSLPDDTVVFCEGVTYKFQSGANDISDLPGVVISGPNRTTLTISSGEIDVTSHFHAVDTESSASTDDLVTINGGRDGMTLVLRPLSDSRTVVIKHNTGNILAQGSDIVLNSTASNATLIYDETANYWIVTSVRVPTNKLLLEN